MRIREGEDGEEFDSGFILGTQFFLFFFSEEGQASISDNSNCFQST